MSRIPLAHLVSLATVGGVERFFTNFASRTNDQFEHHVFLSTDKVHPFFIPILKDAGIVTHSLRKWNGLYLPKFLRAPLHRSLVKQTNSKALVLWNKLEYFPVHFPAGLPLIHFERGSAWLADGGEVKEHLSRCHAILSNSEAGIRILEGRWGLPAGKKVAVAHNGVNPSFTQQDAPIKIKGPVVRLGFAGRFVPLKGWVLALLTLKELLKRTPGGYQLAIGGEGKQKTLFTKLVRDWGLETSIVDMGLVKDMPDFFNSIDIFLHTSLREPFGNVAVEAQALGCPVVGGWMDGNPEIIRPGETGELLPMDWPLENLSAIDPTLIELPPFVWDPLQQKLRPPMPMDPVQMANAVEKIAGDLESYSTKAAAWIRNEYEFKKRSNHLARTFTDIMSGL